ncbi:MAG TPA: hypothetical protein VFB21_11125 [Chthonomonadaceae bacterium]|nr:hypothetical protein [Chthonomonadaceae bacterium]
MKRSWILGSTVIALGALSYLVLVKMQQRAYGMDQPNNYASWQPDAAEVQRTLGVSNAAAPGDYQDERHQQFARLFQERYRSHQPDPIAVGLRFQEHGHIKLMCPARQEPWETNQLAMAAWKEARAIFGTAYDVDIFATYIGTPPVKIGTLRPDARNPEVARIVYDYPNMR